MLIYVCLGGAQFHLGVGIECEQDIAKEARAFEPPVAEKFSIETGRHDSSPACSLVIISQPLFDLAAKMLGMLINLTGNIVRIIKFLIAKTEARIRNFPIAQPATFPLLFVKFEV